VSEPREFRVERAAPEHADALARLFATNGYGCFCRYWHFEGTPREWLARCFQAPERNCVELLDALAARAPDASGMIAWNGAGELVGWLKLAPAATLHKLYEQRLYKGLPCFAGDRSGVWTVGCLLVREDHRRQGVARALLAGAIEAARAEGARALEAFPRSDVGVADAALLMGPLALFVEAGFRVVHEFVPYPVLRLELAPAATSEPCRASP
jgi:GNAT superfamily N-acetyltransferase